jgi:hypothetical protein
MDTLNLTTSASQASHAAEPTRRSTTIALDQSNADPIGQTTVDGLAWTCRNGFSRVAAEVQSAAWAEPTRAGWTRVKHNGSRDVWRATLSGRTYFVKYYFADGWLARGKHLLRGPACMTEWNGGIFAMQRGIPAVRPAGYTPNAICGGRRCSILVTEAIEPAYSLDDYWLTIRSDADGPRRRADVATLVDCLAAMIAHAHQSGFEHLDMHPANILVQPQGGRRYRTLFVDLQSARLGAPLDDHAVVRNLAQLNQWFRRHSSVSDRLRFLRAYVRWRNEHETNFPQGRPLGLEFKGLVAALRVAAHRHAERLWAQRDRRITRTGRYFARVTLRGGWRGVVAVRSKRASDASTASSCVLDPQWWRRQLTDPLRWFADPTQMAKESHSATVVRTVLLHEEAPIPVIVKRPLPRNAARALRHAMPPSRCRKAWNIGHQLLHRDIPAARPLAMIERRAGPFVRDSVLVTEFVPGAADFDAHLRREFARCNRHEWTRHKRELTALLVREIRKLEQRGFAHRDCKAQNILIRGTAPPSLLWIDMDGIRRARSISRVGQLRPLARLHVSLLGVPGLTRTDRARFLKAYFARFGAPVDAWRAAWRELAVMVGAKLERREERRAWKRKHYGRE